MLNYDMDRVDILDHDVASYFECLDYLSVSYAKPDLISLMSVSEHKTKTPPTVELKELPTHLRYAFLGESFTYLVIISSKLNEVEE